MGEFGTKHKRLVLVPCPYQGHLSPMLQLGTILHSKGFSITIVHTKFNSPDPSSHPDFTFLSIPDGLSENEVSSTDFATVLLSLNANCGAPLQELLVQAMELQEQHDKIAFIIYDLAMYYAGAVANHVKVPSIILCTTAAATLLTYYIYPQLQKEGRIPLPDSITEDLIPGLTALRYKDLPIHRRGNVSAYLQLLSNMSDIRSASAVIWNTVNCLEQSSLAQLQQRYQIPNFSIGPLHKFAKATSGSLIKEDSSCIEWLDKQTKNSVLYVSIGSVAVINEKELTEMAWGLANSQKPFLWVIRPGSVAGSEWIELLPKGFREAAGETGYIVKWAPQREVLAHTAVGGFWSHCGWNSTIESISEGIPMMCKPCFGDQKINARYLSQVWKVGLEMENDFDRGDIERAVRMLLEEKESEAMRKRSINFKEKIEISIREGGSSNSSLTKLVEFIM